VVLERRLNHYLQLFDTTVNVVNSGVAGENSAEGLARFDAVVAAHEPSLVTVEFGLNDLRPEPAKLIELDQFAQNLQEIYDRCRGLGAQVILMTPNPVINRLHGSWGTSLYDPYGGCNGAVDAYADVVRSVAQQTQAVLCDIYAHFIEMAIEKQFAGQCSSYESLMCLSTHINENDGVHPTIAGQSVIAGELYKAILLHRLLDFSVGS
jgi:lysophospholipase L1-like esterase